MATAVASPAAPSPGGVMLSSAAGVLSLLDEPEDAIKQHALEQLNRMVDHFWLEIASVISKIETLQESEAFGSRDLAAAVASKVYYHLEDLDSALQFALAAGDLFDVTDTTEYVETLVSRCIDKYISLKVQEHEGKQEEKIDPRLENIVERMFQRCFDDGEYKQAVGIAIESRRLDIVHKAVGLCNDKTDMLQYLFTTANTVLHSRQFRHQVLSELVKMYRTLDVPDYVSMCRCLLFLNDPQAVAEVLDALLKEEPVESALMAYQVAFDLGEIQNYHFLMKVYKALPPTGDEEFDTKEAAPDTPAGTEATPAAPKPTTEATTTEDSYAERAKRLRSILNGSIPTSLYLHWLFGQNKTDLNILQNIKDKLEARNTVTHNATVMAHAIMHCGTTVDTFLRSDLEWLGKSNNWAKFSATASIGVIHKGHHTESLNLLQHYLPQPGQSSSPYQEGGALFALGLIHANHTGSKTNYLTGALRNAGSNEIVQHGACLGIGLTAMATGDEAVYETLKAVVFTDSAVAGEAAGLAMGLVLMGTGHGEALEEMLSYAQDTKHEKIIRGLALGMALIMYGREEASDVLTAQLLRDKDPILRLGGVNAIAMAYVGTSNRGAVKKLLHVAVSDVSDDVRRNAVTALGFVMCNEPHQVPRIVSLLSESYNTHVRYGACLAVGIACAGSGMKEALDLLEPMLTDRVDYVRQGAFMGMAMVLIQHNEKQQPRLKTLRKAINDTLALKGATMAKLGAILAAGIVDAGGRNVTLSLLSPEGHRQMGAIVGMSVFVQFWYWYPLANFISLAFTPTAVIGLNKSLQIPQDWTFISGAAPSSFAYPPPIEVKKKEERKKVPTAELSVTKKAKAKAKKKGDGEEGDGPTAMDEDEPTQAEAVQQKDKEMEEEKKKGEEEQEEKKAEDVEEAAFEILTNPCRITLEQRKVVKLDPNQRYIPLKRTIAGIVMLRDTTPQEAENIFKPKTPKIGVPGVSDDEPDPPQPFQFTR